MPSMPFSVCSMTPLSGGRWLEILVGSPMPRLTNEPGGMSAATTRANASLSMPVSVLIMNLQTGPRGGRHDWPEVARGLAVDQVAQLVGPVRRDEGNVARQRILQKVAPAADHPD